MRKGGTENYSELPIQTVVTAQNMPLRERKRETERATEREGETKEFEGNPF